MRIDRATIVVIAVWLLASAAMAQPPELIAVIKADTFNTQFGKRIMPLGDQNGDGCDDILVADIIGRAYYYHGTDTADTIFSYELRFDEITYFMNNIGDVNGDEFDDFLLPRYVLGKGKLDLYYGGPSMDTEADLWFGYDNLYGKGFSAIGFDFNQNGNPEIISWGSEGWSSLFYELSEPPDSVHELRLMPANLGLADYNSFGTSPVVGLFNGDSLPDLAIGLWMRAASGLPGSIYFYWGGPTFDTIPDLIVKRPGEYVDGATYFSGKLLEDMGDLNGDGFNDLFASSGNASDDSLGFVFFGGPDLDSIPELVISETHSVARSAGDINHDGFDDMIISYPLPFSGMGTVHVYYGGAAMDSIPDIIFTNLDMPGGQWLFGNDCSGVGDFNGDGINDFAFSFDEGGSQGQLVHIYSGTDINTSIDYTYEPVVPDDYTLSQNYPNPFNLSTTIEFRIPKRSQVRLAVYNILGQNIRELIGGTLSAGTYRVAWDGRDEYGQALASGIYLYRLTAGDYVHSRKMLLIK